MAFLDKLKAAKITKPVTAVSSVDPVARARAAFQVSVRQQIDMINAVKAGNPNFKPSKEKYVDGRKQMVELSRVSKWWFQQDDTYYTVFRYGQPIIKIKGQETFECGPDLDDVIGIYNLMSNACEAGELDKTFKEMAKSMGRKKPLTLDELANQKVLEEPEEQQPDEEPEPEEQQPDEEPEPEEQQPDEEPEPDVPSVPVKVVKGKLTAVPPRKRGAA
jgi:hypothetical protein